MGTDKREGSAVDPLGRAVRGGGSQRGTCTVKVSAGLLVHTVLRIKPGSYAWIDLLFFVCPCIIDDTNLFI